MRIVFSADDTVDLNDVAVYTIYVTIGGGLVETTAIAFEEFNLDAAENGTYRVGVIVDPSNVFPESSEVNNAAVSIDSFVVEGTLNEPFDLYDEELHLGSVGPGYVSYYTYWFTSTMGRYLDLKLEALTGDADLYFYLRDSNFIDFVAETSMPSEYVWSYDVPGYAGWSGDGYVYFSVNDLDDDGAQTFDLTVDQHN